jgi:hypothetical protein
MFRFAKQSCGCWVVAFVVLLSASPSKASDNGLTLTPPMGWNSWNKFACNVSEDLIRGAADAIVGGGMKKAGYEYVVIDDCWQVSRDASGNIVADAQRFPSGIKALADYVHSKGLKFGIYSDAGVKTCAGRPRSSGHEYQDALQYAAWGVILFNRGAADAQFSVSREELGYPAHLSAAVRDLWMSKDLGKVTGRYGAKVRSHGVVMIKVLP